MKAVKVTLYSTLVLLILIPGIIFLIADIIIAALHKLVELGLAHSTSLLRLCSEKIAKLGG